ncbi:peptidoglycan editing factor PgeF [Litorilituus lipolyticus]|uniref:Purine nucleoside phosphorylase n=1 Tax=Litorilituus lipolyticus TaxID=2491017 RepID=A0A502L2M6_9GAMM|nr:peptidoglycan editing factor PgeF [Litorilituus lipolyticus]TPH18172.1 peptidoglycan editing factor PgeF [Litorilituus lipolyticus]
MTMNGIHFINWPEQNVLAAQTSRIHPLLDITCNSDALTDFQSFNLGLHVNDDRQLVLKNRNTLTEILAQQTVNPNLSIQWLNQVHKTDVVTIDHVSNDVISADACITRNKDIALAIMTADCLPILLSCKQGNEIAAIHGGWRPLAGNIIDNTLRQMQACNSEVIAWLGPCIGKKAFEVGVDVYSAFITQSTNFHCAFKPLSDEKYLADLHKIAKIQLRQLGVTHIMQLPECTYSLSNKYYSYRRESVTGRMATLISRK